MVNGVNFIAADRRGIMNMLIDVVIVPLVCKDLIPKKYSHYFIIEFEQILSKFICSRFRSTVVNNDLHAFRRADGTEEDEVIRKSWGGRENGK